MQKKLSLGQGKKDLWKLNKSGNTLLCIFRAIRHIFLSSLQNKECQIFIFLGKNRNVKAG